MSLGLHLSEEYSYQRIIFLQQWVAFFGLMVLFERKEEAVTLVLSVEIG